MKYTNKICAISGFALVLATTSLHASFDNSVYQNQAKNILPLSSDFDDIHNTLNLRTQTRVLPNDHTGVTPLTSTSFVPEPTTVIAGALLLLPFGVSAVRIMRRSNSK